MLLWAPSAGSQPWWPGAGRASSASLSPWPLLSREVRRAGGTRGPRPVGRRGWGQAPRGPGGAHERRGPRPRACWGGRRRAGGAVRDFGVGVRAEGRPCRDPCGGWGETRTPPGAGLQRAGESLLKILNRVSTSDNSCHREIAVGKTKRALVPLSKASSKVFLGHLHQKHPRSLRCLLVLCQDLGGDGGWVDRERRCGSLTSPCSYFWCPFQFSSHW